MGMRGRQIAGPGGNEGKDAGAAACEGCKIQEYEQDACTNVFSRSRRAGPCRHSSPVQ